MKTLFTPALVSGLLLSFGSLASASESTFEQRNETLRKTYIVQLKDKPLAAHLNRIPAFALTKAHKRKKLNPNSSNYRKHARANGSKLINFVLDA